MYTQQTTNNRTEQPAPNGEPATQQPSRSPVRVFRDGAIAASVWERQASNGGIFCEYTLSRSWKSKDGEKSGYSTNFTARNAKQLQQVIEQATAFIENRQPQTESEPVSQSSGDTPF